MILSPIESMVRNPHSYQKTLKLQGNSADSPQSPQPWQTRPKYAIPRQRGNEIDVSPVELAESLRIHHSYNQLNNEDNVLRKLTRLRHPVNVPATATFFPPSFQSNINGTCASPEISD